MRLPPLTCPAAFRLLLGLGLLCPAGASATPTAKQAWTVDRPEGFRMTFPATWEPGPASDPSYEYISPSADLSILTNHNTAYDRLNNFSFDQLYYGMCPQEPGLKPERLMIDGHRALLMTFTFEHSPCGRPRFERCAYLHVFNPDDSGDTVFLANYASDAELIELHQIFASIRWKHGPYRLP